MMEANITQKAFSSLLQAMSRPGSVYPMPGNAMMSALHALLDNEVTCHVVGDYRLEEEIRAGTCCNMAGLEDADFIVIPCGDCGGNLSDAKRGTLDYPDKGATVVFGVHAFGTGLRIRLRGPGIDGENVVSVDGWSADHASELSGINAEFPLGVDCILLDGSNVMCIPRSARLEVL